MKEEIQFPIVDSMPYEPGALHFPRYLFPSLLGSAVQHAGTCERITLRATGVDIELAPPFAILAGTGASTSSAAEGANRASNNTRTNVLAVAHTTRRSPPRAHRTLALPVGANRRGHRGLSLSQSKNRVVADAKLTRFPAWWGLINAIGTGNQRVGKEKDDCRRIFGTSAGGRNG